MISILIPIYNGIEFIDESVSSVLNQTYDKWELIIGINGHHENSDIYKKAKEYENKCELGKIKVFDLYKIKGKSNALNEMVLHSSYEYVAILDVDDIWHERKLELQSKYLNKYDVIGSKCIWFGERNGIVPKIPEEDISDFDFKLVNPVINSSAIIKKDLCYWDTSYDGIEDYDLWLRLRKSKCSFYNLRQILVKHRIHNSSAFNSKGNHLRVAELLQKY
jgi:glycosyltransferase involved in cell wall biosynthesis